MRTGPRDDAEPVLVLPGLESHAQPPTRLGQRMILGSLRPLAGARDVWWVDRRAGLRPGVTIADLAADYADGIARRHDGPVDVVGSSTGGSIALQLAADHPRLVRRLVLVSAAARLGPGGRASQRRVAEALAAGRPHAAGAAMGSQLGTPLTDPLWTAAGRLLGPLLFRHGRADLVATIGAEDAFDLTDRLPEVTAPVLVVAGDSDGCYGPELFAATAAGLPEARLVVYPRTGHAGVEGHRRYGPDVLGFLDGRPDDHAAAPARPPLG
ncbi:alpha/beta fold hydrolase [Puerhibacterium sp. TATVAM-FAB25]|uniref:alpha/beta fold hydrolase n=1 Tax=Puerhibacterium sp. TATVAM-FAB25 TaxID=3093699 RepID=UPI00397BAE99